MAKSNKLNSKVSSTETNTFTKGMNKDFNPSFEPKQSWSHARNAANNSVDGDVGMIGNEPANLACGQVPYTIIGTIHLYADQWVLYSTDDINSEIGLFDDSECKYETLVNDPCLNFKKEYLIQGAAKENFDCSWQVYWDDSNNPSRTLNIDNIPYIQTIVSAPGADCIEYADTTDLDCERLRLAPLLDTPIIKLAKASDGGSLRNGSYQAYIAYTVNEQRVTDYIGLSNIQSIFDHDGTAGALDIKVSNLDKEFEFFELVILSNNQNNYVAKRIGLYSTETASIGIDYIDQSLPSVALELLPLRSPAYEKSDAMFVVNDWLIRKGPTEQFDFNYQPIANQIKTEWVVAEYPEDYYRKGGNKTSFLRDEQYAFFIRWIYNTGERSSSYHIPGRARRVNGRNEWNNQVDETQIAFNVNALDPSEMNFQVFNTASITGAGFNLTDDGGIIYAKGDMGYWQSTEKYPATQPEIWNATYTDPDTGINIGRTGNNEFDLCGEYIRHHKMPPDNINNGAPGSPTSTFGNSLNPDNFGIRLIGVQFSNIKPPVYNDGTIIPNVVGYEILRGSREGNRSILAKGIFRNMRKYTIPEGGLNFGNNTGLYPNYPYNDLRPDVYFHTDEDRTDGCDTFVQSRNSYPPLGSGPEVNFEPDGYKRDHFTFSSPDLMFKKPFLNAYETKIYGELTGHSIGHFIKSENHPQNKLLRNGGAIIAGVIGLGYAVQAMNGKPNFNLRGSTANASGGASYSFVGTGVAPNPAFYVPFPPYGLYGLSAGITVAASTLADTLIENLIGTATDLGDLYSGGLAGGITDAAKIGLARGQGLGPLMQGGFSENGNIQDNPTSTIPFLVKAIFSPITSTSNIAIGAQEIIDVLYNLVKEDDFAFKHNSHGFYDGFVKRKAYQLFRSKNLDSNYIGSSFQTFNGFKINNLFRPSTVAIATGLPFEDPSIEDKSRYTVGGDADSSFGNTFMRNPEQEQRKPISALYGALKFNFENQYGQLDSIKQIQMRGTVELVTPAEPLETFSTAPIFAGDVYINRYTEKTIMPIFADFLNGQPDQFTYDYLQRINIPYPRYWMDTRKFDTTQLAQKIITLGFLNVQNALPNDLFYLDRGNDTCGGFFSIITDGDSLNSAFAMRHAYMYTHCNGIQDFFVESDYNLAQRDWGETNEKRFYDPYEYANTDDLLHADIIKKDNFYQYDMSLSISKFLTQVTSFGQVQTRDYDPKVAEKCFSYYPKRLIYSLQAQEESKKDFWRVYLPNNYKDFKNPVNVIKPINKSGALIFFPYQSPQMFQGLDTLKTELNTKLTIGDGGLFSQPFQNIVNSDLSNEYGSCESHRSVLNTPMGIFFLSQAQGKVFHYTGKMENIANQGMKWWFNKYLPSQLIKQFPELEETPLADNPVVGIGCQTIYDINDDIVYFCKKDYKLRDKYIDDVEYTVKGGFRHKAFAPKSKSFINLLPPSFDPGDLLTPTPIEGPVNPPIGYNIVIGDPEFFEDVSWTVSYDPKSKAWISFHDWHPELTLPSINHFLTTKTGRSKTPYCPPGYSYNSVTDKCELLVEETAPAPTLIDEVGATLTENENCFIDIVIAVDTSSSTISRAGGKIFDTIGGNTVGKVEYTPLQYLGNGLPDPTTGVFTTPPGATTLASSAQMYWLDSFMNDPIVKNGMAAGNIQVGATSWNGGLTSLPNPEVISTMSNIITGESLVNDFKADWPTNGGTCTQLGIGTSTPTTGNGGLSVLNNKTGSTLGDRTSDPNFRQILIVITDGTNDTDFIGGNISQCTPPSAELAEFQSPDVTAGPGQTPNTGAWALANLGDAKKQEIYAVFCNTQTGVIPNATGSINAITNSTYNFTNTISTPFPNIPQTPFQPGDNQVVCSSQDPNTIDASVEAIVGSICPSVCECPPGYTLVYPTGSSYTGSDGACDSADPPICRKVTCDCPEPPANTTVTESGQCDNVYLAGPNGDPNYVNSDPKICSYFKSLLSDPSYELGGLWRHNYRCDLYNNYYGDYYPWEVELVETTGQEVFTIRSLEYQLETYVYKGDLFNGCSDDRWHDLDFNFDEAIIHNTEQVSGLLKINEQFKNDPIKGLNFPNVQSNFIDIISSKVEQKYRINQFWDVTNDRGEFTNAEQSIFVTRGNGYIRDLNEINLDYEKSALQRKKFRHYYNKVLLRRKIPFDRKMLLKLNNTKLNYSFR
mgnify:CR=1 FL=1